MKLEVTLGEQEIKIALLAYLEKNGYSAKEVKLSASPLQDERYGNTYGYSIRASAEATTK